MNRPTAIRAHDDGRDEWEIRSALPSLALRNTIDRYARWTEHTRTFTTRRELASTGGVFIINLGSALEIVDAGGTSHRLAAGQGFAGGMARMTSLSRSTGSMMGVHIHLPAVKLAALLGLPLKELCDRVVSLHGLLGAQAIELGESLLAAVCDEERWTILDLFVERRLATASDEDPQLAVARRRLARGDRVAAVADDLGWSRKRLAERLRDEIGLLPREFAGLARFERFTAALQANPRLPLAGAAFDAGYADQAHLTREVRRFADLSPAALRAKLVPEGGGVRE